MKERFERDISKHKMTIEMDNGVHRSVYFGEPGNSCYHFRLTTWPGHLCFSGDMGTFVFSRLTDMFEFFRGDRVNLQYWAEKVQSESRFGGGVMEYRPDRLKETLTEWLEYNEDKDEILESIDPFLHSDYSSREAIRRIYELDGPHDMSDFVCDLSERCYKDYTVHFEWCCMALVWAIGVYDAEKVQSPALKEVHQ